MITRRNKRNQPVSANFACRKMNHFQSKCKQHRYVEQVQAAVSGNEYNVGTLSVFSVWRDAVL